MCSPSRFFLFLVLLLCGSSAWAQLAVPMMAEPAQQCRQAVALMERSANIPSHLMAAIARIESGRADGQGGISPWPWTINVEGQGYVFDSKAAAIAAVSGACVAVTQSLAACRAAASSRAICSLSACDRSAR